LSKGEKKEEKKERSPFPNFRAKAEISVKKPKGVLDKEKGK